MSDERTKQTVHTLIGNAQPTDIKPDEIAQVMVDAVRDFLVSKGLDSKLVSADHIVLGLGLGCHLLHVTLARSIIEQNDAERVLPLLTTFLGRLDEVDDFNSRQTCSVIGKIYAERMERG